MRLRLSCYRRSKRIPRPSQQGLRKCKYSERPTKKISAILLSQRKRPCPSEGPSYAQGRGYEGLPEAASRKFWGTKALAPDTPCQVALGGEMPDTKLRPLVKYPNPTWHKIVGRRPLRRSAGFAAKNPRERQIPATGEAHRAQATKKGRGIPESGRPDPKSIC